MAYGLTLPYRAENECDNDNFKDFWFLVYGSADWINSLFVRKEERL